MGCLECQQYETCRLESQITDACIQQGEHIWPDNLTAEIIKQIRELIASQCPRYQEKER
jgi:hypothetical protein